MPGEDGPELEALARTAAGDRAAFRLVVERHRDAVFRYARTLCPSSEAAEDVLQDTFIAALRHAGTFRGDGTVRGWLLRIARNRAASARRRRSGEPARLEPLDELGQAAGWGADVADEALDQLARKDALHRALEALDEDDREILLLRDVEGLSGEEACTVLGLTLPAMKSRLHRARLRLAATLRNGGFDGTRS